MKMSRVAVVLGLLAVWNATLVAKEWEPANTYAVIVGVLRWEHKGLQAFPTKNRLDQQLYDTLADRGVPRDNMALLLDREATLQKIREELEGVASRAKPGSTLLFYYAGHGGREQDGVCALMNYDVGGKGKVPALSVTEIGSLLKKHFKGQRVLFMADCCHSGGLQDAVEQLAKSGLEAVSLTSADASNISTGNWTFTQTIVDGLKGEPFADADGNGKLTLGELADEVAGAMKYREHQRCGYVARGIEPDWILAAARPANKPSGTKPGEFDLKEYVRTRDGRGQRVGRIVGWDDGKYRVEFYDYSRKRTVDVKPSAVARVHFKSFKVGEKFLVLWGGQPFKAEVIQVDGDFQRITYPGWPAYWDEWVLSNRILQQPQVQEGQYAVEVQWKEKWQPAVVLQIKDEKLKVRYVGHGEESDEWVTGERLRFPAAADKEEKDEAVLVEWGGQWWPAVVKKTEKKRFIHYLGWGEEWDEWVTPERIHFMHMPKKAETDKK